MFEIISKRQLSPGITEMKIDAPRIATSALPGQFLIVRTDEKAERIPLTICDFSKKEGSVTIVTQEVGYSSRKINRMEEGDSFTDVVGPLGRPSDLLEMTPDELTTMRVLFVAGGVGTAPVYPQAKWLHEHGVTADVIIGAKNADMFTYVEEMKKVARVHLCTDDGSAGFHGMVPSLMEHLIVEKGLQFDRAIIIGPMIMMKFAALAAAKHALPAVVSLNALMVDGTGMCGACRVSIGGETKFTCVDGPEFDASKVDFDEAMRRQRQYDNKICTCHNK